MSKSWSMVPLGEVLTERQEIPSADILAKGEIRIVAKIGFGDGRIQFRSNTNTRTDMILIRPGDLVLSGINATKGAIAVYEDKNADPVAATIHYSAYLPNKERSDVRYLWWLLRSAMFRDLLLEYVPGGIKTELKARHLLPIPIPLPPFPEQRRIVAHIQNLAGQVDEAMRLRSQSSGAVARWMESCIDDVMSRYTDTCRFAEVITFNPRSGPSFPTQRDWDGTPVLMPSAVTGFGVNITKVEYGIGNERISEKDSLVTGDILIARGNKRDQVGNAGVVPIEAQRCTFANLLMRLQVDSTKIDPHFCIYWLRSPRMRNHVKRNMTGTSPNIQKINQRIILDYPFPTGISLNEQQRIVTYLDDTEAKIELLRSLQAETSAELDAMLPSILDKAFKGELLWLARSI